MVQILKAAMVVTWLDRSEVVSPRQIQLGITSICRSKVSD